MQQFTYKAKDASGKIVQAGIEATNIGEAAKLLRAKELFPLEIHVRTGGLFGGDFSEIFSRLTPKDRVLFTRQLSTLIKAGLPLAKALQVLQTQLDNPKLSKLVKNLSTTIEGGSTLSEALAMHPKFFNQIYISMIQTGETTGNLDDILLRLAVQEEKNQEINRKIKGALTYPAVVLVVLVVISALMITLVLPQVGKMYHDLRKPLPIYTEIMLAFAGFVTHYWYLVLMMIGGAAYATSLYIASPAGRSQFDRFKFHVPIFNILIVKVYMQRFSRTLGTLVTSGVPMLQALEIVSHSINNVHLEAAIMQISEKVRGGQALSKPISESPLFLSMVGQMLAVGEETGTVGDSLNKVADYYEDEVDEAVRTISTLIEPATMVILGIMIAFLIGAVILPIYGLVSGLGSG
jgi:type IV pilus assembly protein PilC